MKTVHDRSGECCWTTSTPSLLPSLPHSHSRSLTRAHTFTRAHSHAHSHSLTLPQLTPLSEWHSVFGPAALFSIQRTMPFTSFHRVCFESQPLRTSPDRAAGRSGWNSEGLQLGQVDMVSWELQKFTPQKKWRWWSTSVFCVDLRSWRISSYVFQFFGVFAPDQGGKGVGIALVDLGVFYRGRPCPGGQEWKWKHTQRNWQDLTRIICNLFAVCKLLAK